MTKYVFVNKEDKEIGRADFDRPLAPGDRVTLGRHTYRVDGVSRILNTDTTDAAVQYKAVVEFLPPELNYEAIVRIRKAIIAQRVAAKEGKTQALPIVIHPDVIATLEDLCDRLVKSDALIEKVEKDLQRVQTRNEAVARYISGMYWDIHYVGKGMPKPECKDCEAIQSAKRSLERHSALQIPSESIQMFFDGWIDRYAGVERTHCPYMEGNFCSTLILDKIEIWQKGWDAADKEIKKHIIDPPPSLFWEDRPGPFPPRVE